MSGIFSYFLKLQPKVEHFFYPENAVKTKADAYLKKLLDLSPPPSLQNLFQQVHPVDQEIVPIPPTELLPAENLMLHTAQIVQNVAETSIPNHVIEAVTPLNPAEVFKEFPVNPPDLGEAPLASLASLSAAALKGISNKLFSLVFLPFFFYSYNKDSYQKNINIQLKISQKKLITIKLNSDRGEKKFSLIVAPNEKVSFVSTNPRSGISQNTLSSTTRTTSVFWDYLVAPLALGIPKRIQEQKIYNIELEDPNYNSSLEKGPITTFFSLSSTDDEIVRVTHFSKHQLPMKQEKFAANENVKHISPQIFDKINSVTIQLQESNIAESIRSFSISKFLKEQKNESITIIEKLIR